MSKAENRRPGFYDGHYFFEHSEQIPGLQCADLLAWTCYQAVCFELANKPLHPIGKEGWLEFRGHRPGGNEWLLAIVQKRDQLRVWLADEIRADEV